MLPESPQCLGTLTGCDLAELTRRERDVTALVAQGRTNNEIAQTLGLSPTTAKWHVSQILQKLGLRGRVQLAVYARDQGLTEGSEGPRESSS